MSKSEREKWDAAAWLEALISRWFSGWVTPTKTIQLVVSFGGASGSFPEPENSRDCFLTWACESD